MNDAIPPYRLACLFHEIGKLSVRRTGQDTGEHAAASERFLREQLNNEDAADIVKSAHETGHSDERAVELVRAAVSLSRQMGSDPEPTSTGNTDTNQLRDIFATLGGDATRVYPLEPLTLDEEVMFAGEQTDEVDVSTAYERLYDDLTAHISADSNYERLLSALERATWSVPADTERATVPLYDRLRMTAALGEALQHSTLDADELGKLASGSAGVDAPLFTLVKGDLSGLQDFIHRMRSPDDAQERFAKRMRGRSTQLWLLTEGLSRLFTDRLDLPPTALIWSGGGQFYAIIPPDSTDELDDFEREVNEWLADRYDAELFFVLGRATADDPGIDFSRLFTQAASDGDRQKLQKAGPAVEVLSPVLGPPIEPCRSCGRDNRTSDDRCRECQTQESLGEAIATATHLSLTNGDHTAADYTIDLPRGSLSWHLTTGPVDTDRCYRLNSTEIGTSHSEDGFVFTGATVPYGGAVDRVWSFREISDLARSDADFIHVSKMDIDSLGEAFSTGMTGGPARLAALSRALDRFFAGYVNSVANGCSYVTLNKDACERCRDIISDVPSRTVDHSEGPGPITTDTYYRPSEMERTTLHDGCTSAVSPIYIGFSGGDDMFFVGPWDEAVEFSREIRQSFAAYTDDTLTLSSGFFLTGPSYPVGRAVEQAEENLERAKDVEYAGQSKNAAHLFSETQVWETGDSSPGMDRLLQFGERLETLLEDDELSQSVLNDFASIGNEEYPKQLSPGEVSIRKDSSWRLKYLLARHFEGDLLVELEEALPPALPWVDVPVSWAALARR